jgi:histidyl-tRNA synthetase
LGGGGYDLSAVFSAQPTPTMGFGLGFDRLLVALEAEGGPAAPPAGPEVFLAALGDAATQRIVALASQLRARGVVVELDLTGRKPGAAAKHADALGAQRLVILGDRDIEAGAARVKDLKKGTEVEVALDKLVAHLSG